MKKRWLALCLATVMAASLTACGSSKTSTPDTTGTQTTAAGSETKAGGETKAEEAPAGAVEQVVTIPMFSDPDTLDPGRSDDEQKNAIVLDVKMFSLNQAILELAEAQRTQDQEMPDDEEVAEEELP